MLGAKRAPKFICLDLRVVFVRRNFIGGFIGICDKPVYRYINAEKVEDFYLFFLFFLIIMTVEEFFTYTQASHPKIPTAVSVSMIF